MSDWDSMTHAVLGACMSTFDKGEVIYRPGTEWHTEIKAIYRAQHVGVDLGQGSISTVDPQLDLRLADLRGPPPKEGDKVSVRGVLWRVSDVQPDGEGGVKLMLKVPKS